MKSSTSIFVAAAAMVLSIVAFATVATIVWLPHQTPTKAEQMKLVRVEKFDFPASANIKLPANGLAVVSNCIAPAAMVNRLADRTMADGYLQTSFDKLSAFQASVVLQNTSSSGGMNYQPELARPIPAEIEALDGRKIVLQGFMLEVKQENGYTTEFLFLKNQSLCCFGKRPNVNEWMLVHMRGDGVPAIRDRIWTVRGTLHVREIRSHGQLTGIYSLDGDKAEIAADN
jgi:hypothetical protein